MAVWWRMTAVLFLLLVEFSTGQSSDMLMKRFERMESELGKLTERVSELELKEKEQTDKIQRLEERLVTCETQNSDIRTQIMENRDAIQLNKKNSEELRVANDHIISNSNDSERHGGSWQTNSNIRLSRDKDMKYLLNLMSPAGPVKQRRGIQAGKPSMEEIRPVLRAGRQSEIANEQVAFSATITPHDYGPLGTHQTMVFDHVLTNMGNGYHAHSGIFTAPVDGVYLVSVTISGWVHTIDHSYLQMKQNGNGLCQIWAARGHQSTQTLVLRLQKNDEIYVTNNRASDIILGNSYSSFSGFLIYALDAVNAIVGK